MKIINLGELPINNTAYEETINPEEVNLEDPSKEKKTENTPLEEQAANLKQQLEYVAVSRATDTVTIISNNIKKKKSHHYILIQNQTTNIQKIKK